MAIYSAGFSVPGVNAANTVLAQLRTVATDRAKILEVGIFIGTAPTTAPDIGFGRTSGAGTTPTQVANGPADPAEPTSTALLDTGWATRPTYTAAPYLRRMVFPLTVGAGIIWQFTNPIIIPVSAAVGFVNISATGATVGQFSGYFVWDE